VNCSSVKNNQKSKSESPYIRELGGPKPDPVFTLKKETDPKTKVCAWSVADPGPEIMMKTPDSPTTAAMGTCCEIMCDLNQSPTYQ
jgi:hypothetical protein